MSGRPAVVDALARDPGGAPHVVVVGGGLAGLSAALRCTDAGARVTLLEARPRLGGAASSFTRDGLVVDTGQHVVLRCCVAYRALLHRLGTSDGIALQDRLDIPVVAPGRRPARLRRSRLPAPLHLAAALATYPLLRPRERLAAAATAAALGRRRRDGDRETFGSWLRRHGQSDHALTRLWDLIARPALNLPADEASLDLATMVFQTGLLGDAAAGDIGVPRVPLSDLHAGPAAAALRAAGADVRLRARAVAVTSEPGVVLDGGEHVSGDAVVVAVTPDVAARLLARPDLTRLGAVPIVNVHVLYDRKVTDLPFAAGVDTPVQWVFDRSGPSGYRSGQYLAVSLSAADAEIAERTAVLAQRYTDALAELFPAARHAAVRDVFVTREPAATFRQTPGVGALRPGPVTDRPGVVLAGAWTDTGWPATMEGAVRSGVRAAGAALAAAGHPAGREAVA